MDKNVAESLKSLLGAKAVITDLVGLVTYEIDAGLDRALQAVVVAAMTAASLLPNGRSYFVASSRNWMLFVGMLVVAALGSFYVEAELRLLEA